MYSSELLIHIYIYIHVYMYIHVCMNVYTHAYTGIYTHLWDLLDPTVRSVAVPASFKLVVSGDSASAGQDATRPDGLAIYNQPEVARIWGI